MEEGEKQENPVSFPTVGETKKSSKGKLFLVFGILALVGILGFVIFKSFNKSDSTGEDNSDVITFDNTSAPEPTTEPTTQATATPSPIDKSKVQIEVQNGTGITGEAAFLQSQLTALGYTNVKVANATSQDNITTLVTFSNSLDKSVVTELTQKLNSLYQTVKVSTSSTATKDVVIVTGLRKGATAKPSATATATSTPRPSASASPSPTPSATP